MTSRRLATAPEAVLSTIEQRALPGGAELIGHLGGAVYRSYVGRLHPTGVTIALALDAEDDPTPLLLLVTGPDRRQLESFQRPASVPVEHRGRPVPGALGSVRVTGQRVGCPSW